MAKNKNAFKDGIDTICKNCVRARVKEWRLKNKEKHRIQNKKYFQKHKNLVLAKTRKYQLSKIKRTPSWSNFEEIKNFYLNCPEGYEVDHIIPLNGSNVSGLHVINNLQYLSIYENRKKKNLWTA